MMPPNAPRMSEPPTVTKPAAGFPKDRVYHFDVRSQLHKELLKTLSGHTTVLVKGSHAMRMKDTAEFLLAQANK